MKPSRLRSHYGLALAALLGVLLLELLSSAVLVANSEILLARRQAAAIGLTEADVVNHLGPCIRINPRRWALPSNRAITGKVCAYYYSGPGFATWVQYVYFNKRGTVECSFQTGT